MEALGQRPFMVLSPTLFAHCTIGAVWFITIIWSFGVCSRMFLIEFSENTNISDVAVSAILFVSVEHS